ncbi:M14 family metallopeptidase [Pseudoalteromonas sp. MMG012]|uniref:M14 family metallopeptidase n=1 Tax=Pseudoalteromonas sp. MMG012 TaxID=2822686 RepID=UPI001B3A3D0C|nr:M14 family metallopeptidase [Pseudoalteromonas sp. MMG012]MBQ4852100.1 DUF2817 domain-containing protein [Pseudoalteromonas sp. MMG012]
MNNYFFFGACVLSALSLPGCKNITNSIGATAHAQTCQFSQVKFDHNFPMGRLDRCEQLSKNTYKLTLIPENEPINNSPWYAFNVSSVSAHTIHIEIHVEGGTNRYLPKMKVDVHNAPTQWQPLPVRHDNKVMKFDLNITDKPTYIAGQEIITNANYDTWLEKVSQNSAAKVMTIGNSVAKRPIKAIVQSNNSKQWVVILGRQHPPEITGALALFPFTDTLLANTEHAQHFRSQYNILVIPNVNPDGVALGNWRHNANGVDLNRDWKTFKQPETQAVHHYLTQLVKQGHKIAYAIDFHSTRKDIFYTMPHNYQVTNPLLTQQWLDKLAHALPDFNVIQKPGNNPDRGVFKQYIADTYRVHAVTYEMGDNTDRDRINVIARTAANTLMSTLLNTEAL